MKSLGTILRIVVVDFETFAHYGAYLLYVKNVLTGTRHKQVKVKLASYKLNILNGVLISHVMQFTD